LTWRRLGAIPIPPKASLEEHVAKQEECLENQLKPDLTEARADKRTVYFVDVAHFVRGVYLCCVWCLVRMIIRGASGRQRYNVLGAWNATTGELVRVSNTTRVSSDTMVELLAKLRATTPGPLSLVLDNARYQNCDRVKAEAKRLGIDLRFLPSYSPNLNLIERLWKFTKKKAVRGRHSATFEEFQARIDACLDAVATTHRNELTTLMTLEFQTFKKASLLAG
jgi:transposase